MYERDSQSEGCSARAIMLRWVLAIASALIALTAGARSAAEEQPRGSALVSSGLDKGQLKLVAGKSAVLATSRPVKRVSVTEPEIAAVNIVGASNLLITPKKSGTAQVILWDDNEQSQTIDVVVQADVAALTEQLKTLFPEAQIRTSAANGNIVLKGCVPSAEIAEQAVQVAAPYGSKVINLLEVAGGQQVMLQVRFAEVSRSATSALGVNLFAADGSFVGGSNIGQVSPVTSLLKDATVGVAPAFKGVNLGDGHIISPSVTLYGAGQIGSFYLEAFIEALRQNNLLRILAEPNLLAMSGQEASFVAGGEFPIPIAQGGAGVGGNTAITVEFKEFGVKLKFVPVVLGGGRIRLNVAPEVSDLDFTTSVRFNGFVIPGLSKRRVSTTIELPEGQTFAIAGLLNHTVSASKDVTPLLGDLPVLGALFRSVRYQRKETELIVLVTPKIVEAMSPDQVPAGPGEKWRHPTEGDLFLKGDLGGPIDGTRRPTTAPANAGPPPRFYGQYGFNPASR